MLVTFRPAVNAVISITAECTQTQNFLSWIFGVTISPKTGGINNAEKNDEQLLNELSKLLNLINRLGFVTIDQLDMLWSVINQKPKSFSRYVLKKITKRGSLIKSIPKKKSPVHKTIYVLSQNGEK